MAEALEAIMGVAAVEREAEAADDTAERPAVAETLRVISRRILSDCEQLSSFYAR